MFVEIRLFLRRHEHFDQDGIGIVRHIDGSDAAVVFYGAGIGPENTSLDDHISAVSRQVFYAHGFAGNRLPDDAVSGDRPLISPFLRPPLRPG